MIIQQHCPWFLEQGTTDLHIWKCTGKTLKAHHTEGTNVPPEVNLMWSVVPMVILLLSADDVYEDIVPPKVNKKFSKEPRSPYCQPAPSAPLHTEYSDSSLCHWEKSNLLKEQKIPSEDILIQMQLPVKNALICLQT